MFSPKLRKIPHPCKYAKGGVIPAAEKMQLSREVNLAEYLQHL